jgi:hypothetical protein
MSISLHGVSTLRQIFPERLSILDQSQNKLTELNCVSEWRCLLLACWCPHIFGVVQKKAELAERISAATACNKPVTEKGEKAATLAASEPEATAQASAPAEGALEAAAAVEPAGVEPAAEKKEDTTAEAATAGNDKERAPEDEEVDEKKELEDEIKELQGVLEELQERKKDLVAQKQQVRIFHPYCRQMGTRTLSSLGKMMKRVSDRYLSYWSEVVTFRCSVLLGELMLFSIFLHLFLACLFLSEEFEFACLVFIYSIESLLEILGVVKEAVIKEQLRATLGLGAAQSNGAGTSRAAGVTSAPSGISFGGSTQENGANPPEGASKQGGAAQDGVQDLGVISSKRVRDFKTDHEL